MTLTWQSIVPPHGAAPVIYFQYHDEKRTMGKKWHDVFEEEHFFLYVALSCSINGETGVDLW
jgi:hypothetical protein